MNLSEHFTYTELTRTDKPFPNIPNDEQLQRLRNTAARAELVRAAIGNKQMIVSCNGGFRSPEVNKASDGSPTSAHMDGDGLDFTVYGMTTMQIARAIIRAGIKFDQLICENKKGVEWIHISFAETMRQQWLICKDEKYTVVK